MYSLLLTGVVSFFAVLLIPDNERIKTTVIDDANRNGSHVRFGKQDPDWFA